MKYYFIDWTTDWADEFYAIGYSILTEKQRNEELEHCKEILKLTKGEDIDVNFYFGTNEGFENGEFTVQNILGALETAEELSKDQYDTLIHYIGNVGINPLDNLPSIEELIAEFDNIDE